MRVRFAHNHDQAPPFAAAPLPSARTAGWRALSVFSGCGGLDLGFLQEGIFASAAHDIDGKALATYARNIPSTTIRANLAETIPSSCDNHVLLAGAPCQGFSTAGKREVEDPRNALLMRVADIALHNHSQVVVVENVPAATSGPHRRHWEALEDRLRLAGYNVRRVVLEGEASGLAQRRRRLFLLCWLGSDCINILLPAKPALTVREAFGGLEGVDDHDVVWPHRSHKDWQIARHIPPGHRLSNVRRSDRTVATWDIPEVYGDTSEEERRVLTAVSRLRRRDRVRTFGDGDPVPRDRISQELGRDADVDIERLIAAGYLRPVEKLVELRQTYNGRYRRLIWDAAAPTVDTKFGRMDLFLHPSEHRGMTSREAARIQGFPDAFRLTGSAKDKFVQIGNAVPPPMAAAIAAFVREALLKA